MTSERSSRRTDRQLESTARKAAGDVLKPDDELLDIEVGNLRRFRDNGIDKAVTTKKWTNAIPLTRGLMNIAYTRQRALFLPATGPGLYCPLVYIHRAQLLENGNQLFAFTVGKGALVTMEFEPTSRRGSARPGSFIDRLVTIRDAERAKLLPQQREHLDRIDLVVQTHSLDELWARPSAPISMEPDDAAALSGLDPGHISDDGLDKVAWIRLRLLVAAASRGDVVGYLQTFLWQPPGFGLAGHQRTGIYLLYLLWSRVRDVLQTGNPTTEQLHDPAVRSYPALQPLREPRSEKSKVSDRICARICARDGSGRPETGRRTRSTETARSPSSEVSVTTGDEPRRERRPSYCS